MKNGAHTNDLSCRVNPADVDFGAVLNCAVRYAVGRKTYMAGLVINYINPILSQVSDLALWHFDHDLSEAENGGRLGDENVDKPNWISFHNEVKEEIKARKDDKRWQLKI